MLSRRWEVALTEPRPAGSAALIALHANTIVGFALAGPDEAGAGFAESEPGETDGGQATQVYELVVDPDFRRAGHASRLLAAIADLTSGQLRVWVGADDEERQRFYSSAGFAPSGAVARDRRPDPAHVVGAARLRAHGGARGGAPDAAWTPGNWQGEAQAALGA